jgi:hypothetical protein
LRRTGYIAVIGHSAESGVQKASSLLDKKCQYDSDGDLVHVVGRDE